jgi:hypothetical protein
MNAIIITAIHFIFFIGFGGIGALWLVLKGWIPKQFLLIATFAISSLFGYGLFFVYAKHLGTGTFLSGLAYTLGLAAFFVLIHLIIRGNKAGKIILEHWLIPLLLILTSLSFYTCISVGCKSINVANGTPFNVNQSCLLENAPGDNVLPLYFGDRILENQDAATSPGDWKLADRPPLEIGAVISLLDIIPNDSTKLASYQIFATFLQLSWIAGLWALLKTIKLNKRSEKFVWIGSIFSGFYFYNSIYVWPKLLSAAFIIAAISILLLLPQLKRPHQKTPLIIFLSVMIALGLLAHGGVIFSLLPLALLVLLPRYNPGFKYLLMGFGALLIIYSPWQFYKARTTTSDRLVKYQLAGSPEADNRSTVKAVVDSYSSLTPGEWLEGRVKNLKAFIIKDESIPPYHAKHKSAHPTILDSWREHEFLVVFMALGLLNISWLLLFSKRIRTQLKPLKEPGIILGTITVIGMVLNAILLFVPGSTVIHQGSYFTMMGLFTITLVILSKAHRVVGLLFLILQIVLFMSVWILSTYLDNRQSIILAVLSSALGIILIDLIATIACGEKYRKPFVFSN